MGVGIRWRKIGNEGGGILLELVRQLGGDDRQALSFDRVLPLFFSIEVRGVMGERSTLVLGLG